MINDTTSSSVNDSGDDGDEPSIVEGRRDCNGELSGRCTQVAPVFLKMHSTNRRFYVN